MIAVTRARSWPTIAALSEKLDPGNVLRPMALEVKDITVLLGRLAARDRTAFAPLYHATSAKLFGVALRILKRRDLAEDILQEVYVKIWDKAQDFDPAKASPITWMATIARNRALDEVRKRTPISIEETPEVLTMADGAVDALSALTATEDGARLRACIEGLEPERRDLVIRAYLDGESREALGQHFNRPVNTIKTWLHRSLHQLRLCLDQ
jgi:RNA polymerase sigma-70 factor, ECF subfamily